MIFEEVYVVKDRNVKRESGTGTFSLSTHSASGFWAASSRLLQRIDEMDDLYGCWLTSSTSPSRREKAANENWGENRKKK